MAEQALEVLPLGLPLLALLVGRAPAFEILAQAVVVVGHLAEPLVAAEREQGVDVVGVGRLGQRRRASGSAGEILELLEERWDLRALLPALVGDAGGGEKPLDGEPLARRSAARPPCRA